MGWGGVGWGGVGWAPPRFSSFPRGRTPGRPSPPWSLSPRGSGGAGAARAVRVTATFAFRVTVTVRPFAGLLGTPIRVTVASRSLTRTPHRAHRARVGRGALSADSDLRPVPCAPGRPRPNGRAGSERITPQLGCDPGLSGPALQECRLLSPLTRNFILVFSEKNTCPQRTRLWPGPRRPGSSSAQFSQCLPSRRAAWANRCNYLFP